MDGLRNLFDREKLFPPTPPGPPRSNKTSFTVALAIQRAGFLSLEACLLGNYLLSRYQSLKRDSSPSDVAGCFLIAKKYEDGLFGNEVDQVAVLAGVQQSSLERSEKAICIALDFDFCWPNPMHFLRWFSNEADGWNGTTRRVAKAFLIAFTFDDEDSTTTPSLKAAAALYSAKLFTRCGNWTPYHTAVTRYREEDVQQVSKRMAAALANAINGANLPFANLLTKSEMAQVLCSGTVRSKGW